MPFRFSTLSHQVSWLFMHFLMAFSKCETVLLNTYRSYSLCRKTCVSFSCFPSFLEGWSDGPKLKKAGVFSIFFGYLTGLMVDFHGLDFLLGFPRQFVVPPCWFGKPAASTGPLGPDGKPDRGWGWFGWDLGMFWIIFSCWREKSSWRWCWILMILKMMLDFDFFWNGEPFLGKFLLNRGFVV